jgi:hypothetical protein
MDNAAIVVYFEFIYRRINYCTMKYFRGLRGCKFRREGADNIGFGM